MKTAVHLDPDETETWHIRRSSTPVILDPVPEFEGQEILRNARLIFTEAEEPDDPPQYDLQIEWWEHQNNRWCETTIDLVANDEEQAKAEIYEIIEERLHNS